MINKIFKLVEMLFKDFKKFIIKNINWFCILIILCFVFMFYVKDILYYCRLFGNSVNNKWVNIIIFFLEFFLKFVKVFDKGFLM